MSDQEHAITPPELPEPPAVEETLVEKLNQTAAEVTGQLRDLAEELTPPAVEPAAFEAPAVPEVEVNAAEANVAEEEPAVLAASVAPEAAPAIDERVPAIPEPPLLPPPALKASVAPEETSDDRLMAALAWFTMVILQLPIVSIIQLLSPTSKERAFQRHHAVSSLLFYAAGIVYEIVIGVAYAIVGVVTLGIGLICLWPLFFVPHVLGLYYALQAYNGKRVNLPILSDLGRNQGWL